MTKVNLNHNNVRSEEQANRMKMAQEKNICPFCEEGLVQIHKEKILMSNDKWLITPSAFPYDGTSVHYLLIPTDHVPSMLDLTREHWSMFGDILKNFTTENNLQDGALLVKFGNLSSNGSTIEHTHFHLLKGEAHEDDAKNGKEIEKMKVSVGFKYKK